MKGKRTFTRSEANAIVKLIDEKVNSDTNTQKGIRAKIRRMGFHASDFGLRGGYTSADFLSAVTVTPDGSKALAQSALPSKSRRPETRSLSRTERPAIPPSSFADLRKELMDKKKFKSAGSIDGVVPDRPGLYALRIKDISALPSDFSKELKERGHDLIYLGIASQSLKRRMLGQELRARGHGTFFRSL